MRSSDTDIQHSVDTGVNIPKLPSQEREVDLKQQQFQPGKIPLFINKLLQTILL